jgi:hypothetical protein
LHSEDVCAALGLRFARGPSDEFRKLATASITGIHSAAELRVVQLLVQIAGNGVITQQIEPQSRRVSA